MNPLAAAIVVALSWGMKFLVARVLLALGLQLAFVVGLDTLMDYALDQVFGNLQLLDPTIYAVVRLARIPDALAVIGAALLVKQSLTVSKAMFVGRAQ